MDIIARFPRLPAKAVETAVDLEQRFSRHKTPSHLIDQRRELEVDHRLGGGKSLVAVGRGGPMLLERLPTPSPTPVVRAPIRPAARERSTPQPVFPGLSVVVLAVLAAAVWSLAAWNENLRLARQQRPERLAVRPASTQPASP